jgi:hypothetical protein
LTARHDSQLKGESVVPNICWNFMLFVALQESEMLRHGRVLAMNSIIYIVGVVVVIGIVLSFLGLR